MNTAVGITLAVVAGILCWGAPRIMLVMPPITFRIFWVVVVLGLVVSTKIPQPYNLVIMGLLAGMAVFENLYQRHLKRSAARKSAKKEKEKQARRAKRKAAAAAAAGDTPDQPGS